MKILVYSDVHGNKLALETLINTKDYQNADLRIFLGDAVNGWCQSNDCVDMIIKNGDIYLCGNHEIYDSFGIPDEELVYFSNDYVEHIVNSSKTLSKTNREILKKLPKDYKFEVNGIKFYFTHFPWESNLLVVDNPDGQHSPTEKTAKLFNRKEDYIIFGHNHKKSITKINNQMFVCVGELCKQNYISYCVIELYDQAKIKFKQIPYSVNCQVCGEGVKVDQFGQGKCQNCGWEQNADVSANVVQYPNLVSLVKAKKLYQEKKPFIPDFEDFIAALYMYSEMEFEYDNKKYYVTRHDKDKIEFGSGDEYYYFNGKNDFINNAKINIKKLKDIWSDVKNADYMS